MLQEASKIPGLPWALLNRSHSPEKQDSQSPLLQLCFFQSLLPNLFTNLKKLNTYINATDGCINQITVWSSKSITADTIMVCFVGHRATPD